MTSFVVLIEDDEDLRAATTQLLRAHGFQVIDFNSAEAFKTQRVPDVFAVLSDYNLPGQDGLALLSEIAATQRRPPRLALISGRMEAPLRAAAEARGFTAFEKPATTTALLAWLCKRS